MMLEKDKINLNDDLEYIIASTIYFKYLICLTFGYVLNRIGLRNTSLNEILFYVLLTVCLISYIFKKNQRQVSIKSVKIVFFFIAFFTGSILYAQIVTPGAFEIDKTGVSVFELFIYYPIVIALFAKIDNFDRFLVVLGSFARILSIVLLIYFWLEYSRAGNSYTSYDMVQGYQAALCALVLFYNFISQKKLYDIFMFLLTTVVAFLGGSRGSAIVIVIYLALFLILKILSMKTDWKKFFLIIAVVCSALIISVYYYDILLFLVAKLKGYGINSRTLMTLIDSKTTEESNLIRLSLYQDCISRWNDMPIFGYGFMSDRMFLGGYYPHNFFVEVFTQYGFVLGGAFFIWFLLSSAIQILKTQKRHVLLIVLSFAFVQLLLSGTYIKMIHFVILIGLLINTEDVSRNEDGVSES